MLFVGVSMVMVGLTSSLSTMRFRMLRGLCSLGRVFGNLRFLSEWLCFCGQLLMFKFLLQIISCLGDVLWKISIVCHYDGNQWTTYFIIVFYTYIMDLYASGLWHVLGHVKLGGGFTLLLASMDWESYLKCLEFDPKLFDVDCMIGMEMLLF